MSKLLRDYYHYCAAASLWPEKRSYYEALAARVKRELEEIGDGRA